MEEKPALWLCSSWFETAMAHEIIAWLTEIGLFARRPWLMGGSNGVTVIPGKPFLFVRYLAWEDVDAEIQALYSQNFEGLKFRRAGRKPNGTDRAGFQRTDAGRCEAGA